MIRRSLAAITLCLLGGAETSRAVMFLETGDPAFHTTTPGDNSGWHYEGKFMTFLGVPIGPHHFITAKHIGGSVGFTFDLHGDLYTTIGFEDAPGTDIRIWEVNHAKPFKTWAPLSSGVADIGATAAVFGRGTQRGVQVVVSSEPKGWKWGPGDDVKRWGRNIIESTVDGGVSYGELLMCNFDNPGIPGECHLSVGDSGGGVWVLENGLWRLAGVNLAVDGPFRENPSSPSFSGALFDVGGMEYFDGTNWIPLPEDDDDVQSSFYASRVSASLTWLHTEVPESASLSSEDYAAWQTLYFSPAQIGNPSLAGPAADFDGDGVSNLLEFALNLDPIFAEPKIMDAATGLRGLPLVRLETDGGFTRVTIEFVRRSAGSGADLTYTPQFSTDLTAWIATGTSTVTTLNPRWERVKVVDSWSTLDGPKRFARLKVEMAD
jgi:hypothetical protein